MPPFTAIGGNFFGVTSFLLGLDGGQVLPAHASLSHQLMARWQVARRTRLDVIVPVLGFKRCVDYENGFGNRSLAYGVSPAIR